MIVGHARVDTADLAEALTTRGLQISQVSDSDAVAHAVVAGRPDLVVVDMRDDDGVAERILIWICRDGGCNALAITDHSDVDARLNALRHGATDHLVAPFETREALMRVEVLLERQRAARAPRVAAGDLAIDAVQRCASRGGETVQLTPREIEVLMLLVENSEIPVSKKAILNCVWKDEERSENVVEANVSSLRRKLHALGPPVIHTVHRSGYVFRPVAPTPLGARDAVLLERDRLVQERDEAVARRDELLRRRPHRGEVPGPSRPNDY